MGLSSPLKHKSANTLPLNALARLPISSDLLARPSPYLASRSTSSSQSQQELAQNYLQNFTAHVTLLPALPFPYKIMEVLGGGGGGSTRRRCSDWRHLRQGHIYKMCQRCDGVENPIQRERRRRFEFGFAVKRAHSALCGSGLPQRAPKGPRRRIASSPPHHSPRLIRTFPLLLTESQKILSRRCTTLKAIIGWCTFSPFMSCVTRLVSIPN